MPDKRLAFGGLQNSIDLKHRSLQGHFWQFDVAWSLMLAGLVVYTPEINVASSDDEISSSFDQGDVVVYYLDESVDPVGVIKKVLIEVKSSNYLVFQCLDEIPKDAVIMCDRVRTWQKKIERGHKPDFIVVCSEEGRGKIWIPVEGEKSWIVRKTHFKGFTLRDGPDAGKELIDDVYLCRKTDVLEFGFMVDELLLIKKDIEKELSARQASNQKDPF